MIVARAKRSQAVVTRVLRTEVKKLCTLMYQEVFRSSAENVANPVTRRETVNLPATKMVVAITTVDTKSFKESATGVKRPGTRKTGAMPRKEATLNFRAAIQMAFQMPTILQVLRIQ